MTKPPELKACQNMLDAATETFKEERAKWATEKRSLERKIKERNVALAKYQVALDKEIQRADLTPKWQGMDTAPRDGTKLMLWMKDKIYFGSWFENKTYPTISRWKVELPSSWQDQPTHWMPLPPPPAEREIEG